MAKVDVDTNRFSSVRVVVGNVARVTQRMLKTEKYIEDTCSPRELASQMKDLLSTFYSEMELVSVPSHGLECVSLKQKQEDHEYRLTAARNLFLKFLIDLAHTFALPNFTDMDKVRDC